MLQKRNLFLCEGTEINLFLYFTFTFSLISNHQMIPHIYSAFECYHYDMEIDEYRICFGVHFQ
jgi:hypothetical protein